MIAGSTYDGCTLPLFDGLQDDLLTVEHHLPHIKTVSPKFAIDHSPYPCATSPHTIDPDLFILGEDMTAFGPLCLDQRATQLAEQTLVCPTHSIPTPCDKNVGLIRRTLMRSADATT